MTPPFKELFTLPKFTDFNPMKSPATVGFNDYLPTTLEADTLELPELDMLPPLTMKKSESVVTPSLPLAQLPSMMPPYAAQSPKFTPSLGL